MHYTQSILWSFKIRCDLHNVWINVNDLRSLHRHFAYVRFINRPQKEQQKQRRAERERTDANSLRLLRPLHSVGETRSRPETKLPELRRQERVFETNVHKKTPSASLPAREAFRALSHPQSLEENRQLLAVPLPPKHVSLPLFLHHRETVREQDARL